MKPEPVEDHQQLFRDTCLRFAREHIAPHAEAWEEAEQFPRDLYREAARHGILGAGLPEAYGGSGPDPLLPRLALEHGVKIRALTSPDNNLQAVFDYLTRDRGPKGVAQ